MISPSAAPSLRRRWSALGLSAVAILTGGCGRYGNSDRDLAAADRAAAERAVAQAPLERGRAPHLAAEPPFSFSPETREQGDREGHFINASDQAGNGGTVVIDEVVVADVPGWVVIHSGPDIIGVSEPLPAGTSRRVVVELTRPLTFSDQVLAMLHTEDYGNSTFDFPDGDPPAFHQGAIVAIPLRLQVSQASSDR